MAGERRKYFFPDHLIITSGEAALTLLLLPPRTSPTFGSSYERAGTASLMLTLAFVTGSPVSVTQDSALLPQAGSSTLIGAEPTAAQETAQSRPP